MFATVNVTVGAVLSVVIALSPAFAPQSPADLGQPLVFIVLILLVTGNVHGATDALTEARLHPSDKNTYHVYFLLSLLMFVFIEIMVILSYTSLLSSGMFDNFANVRYVWLFVIITCVWFAFGIFATYYERTSSKR